VRGILTLGRYMLWLAVFLFLYSSMLILFQYGFKEYPARLIEGWGSFAQEARAAFQVAFAPKAEETASAEGGEKGKQEGSASDQAKSAEGGEKKTQEVPTHVSLLIWGSMVLCGVGWLWTVMLAMQEGMLWGLGTLFIPLVSLFFWLTHFRECLPPIVLWLIGFFVQMFVVSYYGVDLMEYFFGAPLTPAPPPPPSPLQ